MFLKHLENLSIFVEIKHENLRKSTEIKLENLKETDIVFRRKMYDHILFTPKTWQKMVTYCYYPSLWQD
jgi:hypothetical protein